MSKWKPTEIGSSGFEFQERYKSRWHQEIYKSLVASQYNPALKRFQFRPDSNEQIIIIFN